MVDKPGPHTLELTKRYRMSLLQAAAVAVPCGYNQGKPMGEESPRSIYWFATRTTSTRTTPAMRDAICAARIIRSANKEAANEERWEKTKSQRCASLIDAKRTMLECLSCGRKTFLSRTILDRRARPTCFSCGGTLTDMVGVVDDFIAGREACDEYALSLYELKKAAAEGKVVMRRDGRKLMFGRASIENMLVQTGDSGG